MEKYLTAILLCGILSLLSCQTSQWNGQPISGSYASNASDPDKAELQERGDCAYEVEGKVIVFSATLAELDFTKELPSIYIKDYGWLFVKKDGTTFRTVTFDNGPDIFSDGLARYIDNGKTGFIDVSGRIVIMAQFGFASPFKHGLSRVCNDFVTERAGEHKTIRSGHWGCIDKSGRMVLPMHYSAEELQVKINQLKHG